MRLTGDKTIVSANGDVLYTPDNPQGLVIVEDHHNQPVLLVSEVSDGETVNLFIDIARNSCLIDNSGAAEYASPEEAATQFEILADRSKLGDEFVPAWESDFVRSQS